MGYARIVTSWIGELAIAPALAGTLHATQMFRWCTACKGGSA